MKNSVQRRIHIGSALILGAILLTACGKSANNDAASLPQVSGGRSALATVDAVVERTAEIRASRSAVLLGIFISDYLSRAVVTPALGALKGIAAQNAIVYAQSTVTDPDYDLLQTFADALQVDISDLLNRSVNRQETLDIYAEALQNVAGHANDRYKELTASKKELETQVREQQRAKSTIEREVQKAISAKDFSLASDKQRALSESEATLAALQLELKRTDDIVKTLDKLLSLFGERILAIQKNREALIAGTKIVDMPGVADLKIIQKDKGFKATGSRGGNDYDALFPSTSTEN